MMRALTLVGLLMLLAACGTPKDPIDARPPPTLGPGQFAGADVVAGWTYQLRPNAVPDLRLAPTLDGDRVFLASGDGTVAALDADTGERIWRRRLDAALSGGPAAGDELVVIGSRGGRVHALSADTGETLWISGVTSEMLAPAAIGQDVVVIRLNDGRLFALEPESGERRWIYDRNVPALSLRGHSRPVLVGGGVVAGFDNGRLAALTLDDGTPVWDVAVGTARGRTDLERMTDIDGDPVVDGQEVFAASYQSRVASLGLREGRIAWSREISSSRGLTVDRERVYVSDDSGRIWSLDRRTGASVWRQDALEGYAITAPVRFGNHLVVASEDGYVYWLALADGELVDRRGPGSSRIDAPPVLSGDRLFVQSLGGHVMTWRLPD